MNYTDKLTKFLLRGCLSYHLDYIETLNVMIDNCKDQAEREWLTIALEHYNFVITYLQKVLDKKEKNE